MCELVVLSARFDCLTLSGGSTFRVGRSDQAKFRVENVNQVIEVSRSVRVTRCNEQLLSGSHLPFDIRSRLRQEGFENRLGCLLVNAMLRWSGRCAKGLFEECQSDTLRTAHFP